VILSRKKNMVYINGPVVAAVDLEDSSHEILCQANDLASFYNVELHVCHVLPEIFAVRPLFPQLHLDDALKLAELEAAVRSALLERIQKETGRESTQVVIAVEQGTAHAGILRFAESIHAGVIVVGGKFDRQGLPMLGRAAELVVRYAHCPVLVARASPPGKVLAATDFSDPSLPAVEAGAAEARRRKIDLAIIHAIDLSPLMRPEAEGVYAGAPREWSNQLTLIYQKKLEECVYQFNAKGGGLLQVGPAAPMILHEASILPAQLLVVGTHGRTGLERLALGNVAEAVVRQAPCSILVVRLT
jgi:nucleotide-binding universal stress UspA family protein